ncbi:hypothetical protein A7U58_18855 [Burkholderia pseudomallei]|nr:hypothetical protein A7U58_18855 [Burkholderia pseudomallei]ANW58240.1 hypothetical protein A7U59_18810 [Burkholderia pseudomallei]OMQ73998.1 hypothetical protein AQ713_03350 [Burkholderia pseudomallei]OSO81016.1 hypothetical protein BOC56_30525 [Burkholderia pseudomallei]
MIGGVTVLLVFVVFRDTILETLMQMSPMQEWVFWDKCIQFLYHWRKRLGNILAAAHLLDNYLHGITNTFGQGAKPFVDIYAGLVLEVLILLLGPFFAPILTYATDQLG